MSEDKAGLLVNLFDKDFIYTIDKTTSNSVAAESKELQPKVISDEVQNVKVEEERFSSKVWGNNAKGILILLDEPSSEVVPQKSLAVLGKIFEALKMDLENDVAIINLSHNSHIKRDLLKDFSPKLIIHFGINMFQLGYSEVELHNYEMKEVDNTIILSSDPIEKMMAKVEAKKAFWLAVQRAVSNL